MDGMERALYSLQRQEALALGQLCGELLDAGQVDHLYEAAVVGCLADSHLAAFVHHLGTNLKRRAFHLALLDVAGLPGQIVV